MGTPTPRVAKVVETNRVIILINSRIIRGNTIITIIIIMIRPKGTVIIIMIGSSSMGSNLLLLVRMLKMRIMNKQIGPVHRVEIVNTTIKNIGKHCTQITRSHNYQIVK